jgi:putative ABC transport system permease protein
MLELKNIKKDYPAGDGTVHALKGIDLKFRRSEWDRPAAGRQQC